MTTAIVGTSLDILDQIAKIVGSRFTESLKQRFNNEDHDAIVQWQNLINVSPLDTAALDKLLRDTFSADGQAVTPFAVGDRVVNNFPVEYLTILFTIARAYGKLIEVTADATVATK